VKFWFRMYVQGLGGGGDEDTCTFRYMHPEEIGLQDLESLFLCLYFKHATDV
jgi:hypothetical protein